MKTINHESTAVGPERDLRNIRRVVIHSMRAAFQKAAPDYSPLRAPEYLDSIGLSAHYFISPNGVLVHSVPIDRVAWHAKDHNMDSIGIEFLVGGVHHLDTQDLQDFARTAAKPWTRTSQLEVGVRLVESLELVVGHPLSVHRHSDLDTNKVDPGDGFPWTTFLEAIESYV